MSPPLWFLDVDGVVNAVTRYPDRGVWPDFQRIEARASGTLWPIWFSPTVIEFLARTHLAGRAELRWLTTWEHEANLDLREKLGLADLGVPALKVAGVADPCACRGEGDSPGQVRHGLQGWWKRCAVEAVLADDPRPFIWTDDDLRIERHAREWARSQGGLPLAPFPTLGLAPHDLQAITEFLDA